MGTLTNFTFTGIYLYTVHVIPHAQKHMGQVREARHTRGQGKQVGEHGRHGLAGRTREAARTLLALQAREVEQGRHVGWARQAGGKGRGGRQPGKRARVVGQTWQGRQAVQSSHLRMAWQDRELAQGRLANR